MRSIRTAEGVYISFEAKGDSMEMVVAPWSGPRTVLRLTPGDPRELCRDLLGETAAVTVATGLELVP